MRRLLPILMAFAAFALIPVPAQAHPEDQAPCDFLTGGGFIITTANNTHPPAKANFGVGGGCKHGSPTWGHLQYIDHGNGLNVHWKTITAYMVFDRGYEGVDAHGQPTGARLICGTARTNLFGDVDFLVLAGDRGEPGRDDEFITRVTQGGVCRYTTEHDSDLTLGGSGPGGGNIQLHKPNPSTTGAFGGSCPALAVACIRNP